ncbi:MAG: hypothetical protein RLZZ618_1862 [Pseudomonadota bacterium]|jgi:enoyl-CoA hydratase
MTDTAANDVLFTQRGGLGVVTLNRPQALNALSLGMVRSITAHLLHWQNDSSVHAVALRGAGRSGKPPAFCAGGDIRAFHEAARTGAPMIEDFFTEEYSLDHFLHYYPKPTFAFMDGTTMGGGMGLAQGAAVRIVTEHSRLAMPETLIGFFPDVGGGWFLSRCEGRLGEYLALTGHTLDAAEAIHVGLADVFVPSADMQMLLESMGDQPHDTPEQWRAVVATRAQQPPNAPRLAAVREAIDLHFAAASLPDLLHSLQSDSSPWAKEVLATLAERSPLMLAVTLEQIRRARSMTLAETLRLERGMVRHCFDHSSDLAGDTVEGIRALVIDRDRQPRWSPARVDDVRPETVSRFFESPWPAFSHPLRHLR